MDVTQKMTWQTIQALQNPFSTPLQFERSRKTLDICNRVLKQRGVIDEFLTMSLEIEFLARSAT